VADSLPDRIGRSPSDEALAVALTRGLEDSPPPERRDAVYIGIDLHGPESLKHAAAEWALGLMESAPDELEPWITLREGAAHVGRCRPDGRPLDDYYKVIKRELGDRQRVRRSELDALARAGKL
jgi:hypothetical protein